MSPDSVSKREPAPLQPEPAPSRLSPWKRRRAAADARAQADVDRALAAAERDTADQLRDEAAALRSGAEALREAASRLRDEAASLRAEGTHIRAQAGHDREEAAVARIAALKARAEASAISDLGAQRNAAELALRAMLRAQEATARDRDASSSEDRAAERDRDAAEHERRAAGQDREAAEKERQAGHLDRRAASRDASAAATERDAAALEGGTGPARDGQLGAFATVGTFAAGLAHRLTDPLSSLLANLSFATGELRKLGPPPEGVDRAEHALDEASFSAERLRRMLRSLKSWSGLAADEGARAPVQPRLLLDGALAQLPSELRPRARLVREDGEAPAIVGSAGQLEQVLLQLLINALQAIGEVEPERHQLRVGARFDPALQRVIFSVSDDGPGIPAEALPHLFEPFSAPSTAHGAGLGLYLC